MALGVRVQVSWLGILLIMLAESRGDSTGAIDHFGRVEGAARERAQVEIARLKAQTPAAR